MCISRSIQLYEYKFKNKIHSVIIQIYPVKTHKNLNAFKILMIGFLFFFLHS